MRSLENQNQACCSGKIKTMAQVIKQVNDIIERSFRENKFTKINGHEVAQLSCMLSDVDLYARQKFGKSFYDFDSSEIDLEFLNSYKENLLLGEGARRNETANNHLLSMHIIFILCDAYCIANMDIDMFESFMKQTKQEGKLLLNYDD